MDMDIDIDMNMDGGGGYDRLRHRYSLLIVYLSEAYRKESAHQQFVHFGALVTGIREREQFSVVFFSVLLNKACSLSVCLSVFLSFCLSYLSLSLYFGVCLYRPFQTTFVCLVALVNPFLY